MLSFACLIAGSWSEAFATDGLGTHTDFPAGGEPSSVAIGDLNGDGKADMATANSSGNTVSVMLGDGAGGFGPKTDVITGMAPPPVVIGDLNQDGWGRSRHDELQRQHGLGADRLGDGTFRPHVDASDRNWSVSLALGDFNRDGVLDVAVSDRTR